MADVAVSLRWLGEGLRFEGSAAGGPAVVLDGDGIAGPSPVQTLLIAFGGCTAADVVEILTKGRVPFTGLEVGVEADRAATPPRYVMRARLTFTARGLAADDEQKLQRAVLLSAEKYCSVLHTLRPDLEVSTTIRLA